MHETQRRRSQRALRGLLRVGVMSKLRLVKVVVQPFFVLDDGENIVELDHTPTVIPASEWPTYSSERFPAEVAAWQAKLDGEEEAIDPSTASGSRHVTPDV